jgi:mannosyl-oligosaccharide alpha-1,2-mannosidase
MYKDKPYNYPFSRRGRGRKFWAVLILVAIIAWFYVLPRIFGHYGRTIPLSKPLDFGNRGAKGEKGWAQKREAVVKAMERSWAGYENYAWGTLFPRPHRANQPV